VGGRKYSYLPCRNMYTSSVPDGMAISVALENINTKYSIEMPSSGINCFETLKI
jgi:hypothetical protein